MKPDPVPAFNNEKDEAEALSRARQFAAQRGLRYQTYLKILLHEALDAEEKKLASS
jgi:hypothetical protein